MNNNQQPRMNQGFHPKPMSGVSTIKNPPRFRPGGQDLTNFQNPTTRYFKTREVNLNDSYPYCDNYETYPQEPFDPYYQPEPYTVECTDANCYEESYSQIDSNDHAEPDPQDFQTPIQKDQPS